jgi:hypothetical protein
MKSVIILSILAAVVAFSPSGRMMVRKTSSLQMGDFSKEIGAQAPLGFWDPLGLLMNAEQERFDYLRDAELKHGRIAMLAVLGHIVTTKGDRLPGEIAYGVPFTSIRSGLAAFEDIPAAGFWQVVLFIGLIEYGWGYQKENIEESCTKAMNSLKWSEATQDRKKAIELNNGRAAQMGILGLIVHEKLNNNPYVLNSILGSPVPFNQ